MTHTFHYLLRIDHKYLNVVHIAYSIYFQLMVWSSGHYARPYEEPEDEFRFSRDSENMWP